MLLIGQYDSPFVRRVAIAMRLYGIAYQHKPWSTFGDADTIAPYNPLRRVPTLVLDNGEVLIESMAILDYVDELAGPDKALIAPRGPERYRALKICALAMGLGDKAVSLLYERVLRKDALKLWVERCETQIGGVYAALEKERATVKTPYWFGKDSPTWHNASFLFHNTDYPKWLANTAIVGLGVTGMGRIYGRTTADFAAEAIGLALDDAG